MLNKNGLVEFIAEHYGKTKKDATEIIDTFVDAYTTATYSEGGVNLTGFAKSEVVDVPEKECRNPKTGETFTAPAHKTVKVKISKKFKNLEI